MKGVDKGKGNVVSRDDWQTPEWLFDILDEQYKFRFDLCASDKNSKCMKFFSENNSFLDVKQNNHYLVGSSSRMNPPFSKAKQMIYHFFKVVNTGVGIYRADNMETKVWQFILNNADWVHIFDKRINYEGKKGSGAVFGSALFGIGLTAPKGLGGTTLKKYDAEAKN